MDRATRHMANAREHDARALVDVALRMQMRAGDEFGMADQILSVASQLRTRAREERKRSERKTAHA